MEPVEIRRLWYRVRFDDAGITIGRKPPMAWDRIGGAGVDIRTAVVVASLIPVLQYATTWLFLASPCLHICVRGDRYPVAIPAVPLKRRWRQRDPASQPERRKSELREVLGEWLDRFPVVCPMGDLATWWVGQERRPAIPNRVAKEPTSHERVEAVHHELEHLQHELDQINRRKKHDVPPPTQF